MKALKIIGITALVIFVIYLILCAMGPQKMGANEKIMVNASPETVYSVIGDYNEWKAWSPWQKKDPSMAPVITGQPMSVGHKMAWTSKEVGSGEQEFIAVVPNESIRSELRIKDMGPPAMTGFVLKPVGEGTEVNWTMDESDISFMARGIILLGGWDKMLKADYVEGLQGIKEVAEAKPKKATAPAVPFEIVEVPETKFVGQVHNGISMTSTDSKMYDDAYAAIGAAAGDKISGPAFSIARKIDMETGMMDLELAMPVSGDVKPVKGLTNGVMPAGKVAKHVFVGPYEKLGDAWMAFDTAVREAGHTPQENNSYEVYIKSPGETQNPEEYVTWLMIPIQ